MKDNIFIIWSGTQTIADCVKRKLEEDGYRCFVGGNGENNSQLTAVGDTVIQQMKTCNQAIVIFQNKSDGNVSGNLLFELGYALAMYGQTKVHCVRKESDTIRLPSDFDSAFVEPLACHSDTGNIHDEDAIFVDQITAYFFKRQRMSITTNKMYLINNRYKMQNYIQRHYSDQGSACSDYELAQYVLFYCQAANMFGDAKKVLDELTTFKGGHQEKFSDELMIAVNTSIAFLKMVTQLRLNDHSECYIDELDFSSFCDAVSSSYKDLQHDDIGIFNEWAMAFSSGHIVYAHTLVANNPSTDISEEERKDYMQKAVTYGQQTIENLKKLQVATYAEQNNDHRGLISLLYAYVYRNLFVAYRYLGDTTNEREYLKKTKGERYALKNNYAQGTIDSKLYENFAMEYYLCLSEYIQSADFFDIPSAQRRTYCREIKDFIQSVQQQRAATTYMTKIQNNLQKYNANHSV